MPQIVAQDVRVVYPNARDRTEFVALENVTLEVEAGEFLVIVGPSGCGKTTFLNAVAGLLPISSGSLTIDGREVEGPGPDRAMVFQEYASCPGATCARTSCSAWSCAAAPAARRWRPSSSGISAWSGSKASSATTRTSSRAACASAWGSRAR